MSAQGFDPIALAQLKTTLTGLVSTIRDGEVRMFPGFLMFRRGSRLGAAIDTGDRYVNIHNVNPGQSFTLDGDSALPGVPGNYLVLTINTDETDLEDPLKRETFVNMMLFFVSEQGGNRDELLRNPWDWAKRVIEMTGNRVADNKPYPYIAELVLLNKLRMAGLLTDPEREYRGPDAGAHDFELATMSLECKAHLHGDAESKKGELVVSSEYQLSSAGTKPLYVVYFQMEDTGDLTLAKCVEDFGSPRPVIMQKLTEKKFVEGDFSWARPYHLQADPLVFEITEDFPRITPGQFPNGHFPSGITKLIYHVSVQNLPSCSLETFLAAKVSGKDPQFTF